MTRGILDIFQTSPLHTRNCGMFPAVLEGSGGLQQRRWQALSLVAMKLQLHYDDAERAEILRLERRKYALAAGPVVKILDPKGA